VSDTSVSDMKSDEIDLMFARDSLGWRPWVVEFFKCASLLERGI